MWWLSNSGSSSSSSSSVTEKSTRMLWAVKIFPSSSSFFFSSCDFIPNANFLTSSSLHSYSYCTCLCCIFRNNLRNTRKNIGCVTENNSKKTSGRENLLRFKCQAKRETSGFKPFMTHESCLFFSTHVCHSFLSQASDVSSSAGDDDVSLNRHLSVKKTVITDDEEKGVNEGSLSSFFSHNSFQMTRKERKSFTWSAWVSYSP